VSSEASAWALLQTAGDPLAKFLLLLMADGSGTDGRARARDAYFARVAEATPEAIEAALLRLQERGLVRHEGNNIYALLCPSFQPQKTPYLIRQLAQTRPLRCEYCGTEEGPFQADHIIPKGQGGSDALWNRAIACSACNGAKGNRTPEEWRGA
jgi:hypothetical protein